MLFASTGCSFTFGQGLYWDRILEKYKDDWDSIRWSSDWPKIRTMLSVEDLKYMKSFTYSYLLSKTLDCEYITNPGDGMWEYNLPPSNFESYKVIDVWIENQQKNIDVKEIKFRPNIDTHDYQVKMRSVEKFLSEGDKVKITLRFRGREMVHQDRGVSLLEKVREEIDTIGKVELLPKMEGRQMVMVLAPK